MSDTIKVEKRETTGTLRMRRLRQSGKIPAVIYGHGQDTIMLSADGKDIGNAIRAGQYVVKLSGALDESALIKEVQWDALGSQVVHLDFSRIDEKELVEVTLPIEIKGSAPGTKSGGTLRHLAQELEIACPANVLPDRLECNINELQLDQIITAGEIELPPGASLTGPADAPICQCLIVEVVEEQEDGDAAAAAEPEVIGRKAEDEENE